MAVLVLIPLTFLLISYLKRLDQLSGDFTRSFPYKYSRKDVIDLEYNSYYIAGTIGKDIYLANSSVTPRLLKINSILQDTQTVVVKSNAELKKERASYEFIIDSPYFYLCYGLQRTVLNGSCSNWHAFKNKIRSPFFLECVPLSPNSMVYRYVSSKTGENSFRKEFLVGDSIENDLILEKQVDGRFCTSGSLEYNKNLHLFTYLYAYRNQILVIDTNLKLIKKIKTIDHIDTAQFEVSKINSSGKTVITKPTILVNPKCASYKQYLLVHSKIMGKGEDDKKFERSTIIDIYDVEKGKYIYSLSLPNYHKSNISQLKVINGDVYVMLGRYFQKYTVRLPE